VDKAVEEIVNHAGKKYDPQQIEAFTAKR